MILLVFEGEKDEPKIMATIKRLFFNGMENQLLCSYGTDTYTLWKDVRRHAEDGYEVDIFQIVKERLHKRGDHTLDGYFSYQIDSIYMFFDYDPQNTKLGLGRLNPAIESIVEMFNDPMDKGQIFISYPMVEALYCMDSISGNDYLSAVVPTADCSQFKKWIHKYSIACNKSSIILKTDGSHAVIEEATDERLSNMTNCWNAIVKLNAMKANRICNSLDSYPDDIGQILQRKIFNAESEMIATRNQLAIISAFAMFLYEYFHGNGEM